ncbi:MAG: phage tail tape measure protein [Bacillota bacterium]
MADVGEIKAKLTMNSSDFSRKMDDAKGKMTQMDAASKDTKKNLDAIQKASLAVGGAVVAGIGASVGVAANFEHAMARVGAVSNATGADFELMEAKAKELGETTMFSATQAAEGRLACPL